MAILAVAAADHEFRLWNNCPFQIWPGLLNNPNKALPLNGGFALDKYQTKSFRVPDGWAGRVWARTNCNGAGHCETGDCGNKIECHGAGGVPPVSLAEFTLDGWQGQDYYDVSLVDGYNLPIAILPIDGTFRKVGGGQYDCNQAGCKSDINAHCPAELALKNGGGATVACKSACMAFNTDEYCCRGAHNRPETCKSRDWKVNYPAIFKQSCPDAYSYAYDDTSSTFTCHSNGGIKTGYVIKFCP
uniref:Thaumatin-like protein n=1 Tax=Aleuroglyphus ovatus TaxID=212130 RepID=A7XZI2_ALEOV|nr:thaumatin-like protein [Aleuroglyphus ovatus]